MKKIVIVLLALCTITCSYFVLKNKYNTKEVFYLEDTYFNSNSYNVFYLNLEEENITTSNLSKYFDKMEIISVVPYINPIYKDKVKPIKYYFKEKGVSKNIGSLVNDYKDKISKYGYLDNLSYIDVSGLKINEIEVYAKGSDIVSLIYSMPKIKYKNFLDDTYNYLVF